MDCRRAAFDWFLGAMKVAVYTSILPTLLICDCLLVIIERLCGLRAPLSLAVAGLGGLSISCWLARAAHQYWVGLGSSSNSSITYPYDFSVTALALDFHITISISVASCLRGMITSVLVGSTSILGICLCFLRAAVEQPSLLCLLAPIAMMRRS